MYLFQMGVQVENQVLNTLDIEVSIGTKHQLVQHVIGLGAPLNMWGIAVSQAKTPNSMLLVQSLTTAGYSAIRIKF